MDSHDSKLTSPNLSEEDVASLSVPEWHLRPLSLHEYVGQQNVKEKLKIFIQAAQQRKDVLDHALFSGPPGLGKTTLAHIIAHEMHAQIHTLAAPNIEKKGDLAAILTNLQPGEILFVDEIHRLPKPIEEVLYSAMEDFKLDLIIGQGPAARTIQIEIPRFTLVGATTRSGLLSSPLRDRFGVQLKLDYYPAIELKEIVIRSARLLKLSIAESCAAEIAKRSRGTPRIANRLLKRVRDFAQVHKGLSVELDLDIANQALRLFEVDDRGLDLADRKYLRALIEKFDGGPVGVETLCAALGEERDTLEEIIEPFLLQQGFIQRTPRGRVATPNAFKHLDIPQDSHWRPASHLDL